MRQLGSGIWRTSWVACYGGGALALSRITSWTSSFRKGAALVVFGGLTLRIVSKGVAHGAPMGAMEAQAPRHAGKWCATKRRCIPPETMCFACL